MAAILCAAVAAALFFIFLSLKKNMGRQSVFKDTVDIINEIMKEPDDGNNDDKNDDAE